MPISLICENQQAKGHGFFTLSQNIKKLAGDVAFIAKPTLSVGSIKLDYIISKHFTKVYAIQHVRPPTFKLRSEESLMLGVFPRVGFWRMKIQLNGFFRSIIPNATVCVSDSIKNSLVSNYYF